MSKTIRVVYTGKHSPEYEGVRRALAQSTIINVADSDRQALRVLRGLPVPGFVRLPMPKKRKSDDPAAGVLARLPNAHLNG